MKKQRKRRLLQSIRNYITFFIVVAFAVTCCMMLFLSTLADTMGIAFTSENLTTAAKLTFGNVLLITFIFASVDFLRRKLTVERPVRKITEATERIMQGDFSVRIPPIRDFSGETGFNQIAMAINQMAEELSGT